MNDTIEKASIHSSQNHSSDLSIQSQFHLDDREHFDGLTRRKKNYLILTEMFLGASNKCQRPRVICGSYNVILQQV